MKKSILMFFIVLVTACVIYAESEEYGPIPNYKGWHETTGIVVIPTTTYAYFVDPFGNTYKIKARGGKEFEIHYPTPIFVDSFVYLETAPGVPFDPETDDIIMTEIFALDLDPGLDPNMVPPQSGFNPADAEIVPTMVPGYFEGLSGTQYPVPVETLPVSDLPVRLPGYDVSKIMDIPPGAIVHLMQRVVPAADFVIKPFEFTYEYGGYFEQSDPEWVGPKNPKYPYQHYWELIIHEWSDVEYVSDVDIEEPWTIKPGYVEVVPPENWHSSGITVGRMGYESNPGAEIGAGGGSLGIAWRVNGKIPAVIPGHVVLTQKKVPISRIMNTMVVDSEPNYCGDWGYLRADFDEDCDVDMYDFAHFAQRWLDCTDPQGERCSHDSIVGVGFAFDGDDTSGPAMIGFLYDDSTCSGILEPGDVIAEYRGIAVTSGAQLRGIMEALPDVAVGAPVPMVVLKQGSGFSRNVAPAAQEIPVVAGRTSSENKRCAVGWITPTDKKTCHCIPDSYVCACGWEAKRGKNGKIMSVRYHCADTGGNTCHGDWITVK